MRPTASLFQYNKRSDEEASDEDIFGWEVTSSAEEFDFSLSEEPEKLLEFREIQEPRAIDIIHMDTPVNPNIPISELEMEVHFNSVHSSSDIFVDLQLRYLQKRLGFKMLNHSRSKKWGVFSGRQS
jgi:hypothetical protein